MLGILLLYNNSHRWLCQEIHTNHWVVQHGTVILILSSNKTIRTFIRLSPKRVYKQLKVEQATI